MPKRPSRLGVGRWLSLVAAAIFGGACAAPLPPAVAPTPGDFFVAGYHPYWAGEAWQGYPLDVLDQLFFFEVELASDGALGDSHGWPGDWSGLVDAARDHGVQIVPTVTLHGDGAFERLFSDPAAVGRAVDTVVGLVRGTPGVRGVHLDVEVFDPVSMEARDGYTAFVAGVRAGLRGADPGYGLSVFTLAFDEADAYNERALASVADFLVIQGYDLHHQADANAGPLAPLTGWDGLDWEGILARYDGLGVPRSRMVMGIPLYGYQWPTTSEEPGADTRASGIPLPLVAPAEVLPDLPRAWDEAARHGTRTDPASGIPYYAYRGPDGGWIQGWFEDRESLRAKLDFVESRGLAGAAFFPLAYAGEGLWEDLRQGWSGTRP